MKIRFISDIHATINQVYGAFSFSDIMNEIQPADITLIAGDLSACIPEAKDFLEKYFKNEKVVFVGGNHLIYNSTAKTLKQQIAEYKTEFDGQWKFLENDWIWLDKEQTIAVIGCIGWTDFLYGHQTKSDYVNKINKEKEFRAKHPTAASLGLTTTNDPIYFINSLPEDPASDYDERGMGNKKAYRKRRMMDALRGMNDYQYGKWEYRNGTRCMLPMDTYKMHKESMRYIKHVYQEIVGINPDATIILMTHHPFVKECISKEYTDSLLNAAFVSNHNKWLKQFSQIKYLHSGHVHQRCFKKLRQNKQIICNPMGYLYYYENIGDCPFDINYMINI